MSAAPNRWNEISPYLEQALTLSGEEREAWLAGLRRKDATLVDELEALLSEHRALSEEGFLERAPPSFPQHAPLAGQNLGPYRLTAPIGHGGMSTVWAAERADGRFRGRVAIKFLNFALHGPGGQARFAREGSILGRLAHPHIAHLMDAGVSQAGQPYLVLEYIEGEQIDRYCERHGLDIEARLRLFLDVLSAVAHAHAHLIVHRDLKPSNVLVQSDSQVKLLDFGIAKLLNDDAGSAAATMLTRESGSALTPLYAAPEQVTDGSITTATDVYALGVLLYVLLTGQHPAGATHSAAELIKAITETEPRRPSDVVGAATKPLAGIAAKKAATPDKLARALRGDLDTIILHAVKKNPQERYTSVTAFADDVRRYLGNEPIAARPDTVMYRAQKFVRRNRNVVALACLALVAMLAGIVGTLLQARSARAQRDFAFQQLGRAERINALNYFLFTDAAPSGQPVSLNELLARAEHILQRENYANDPATHVQLLVAVGGQYLAKYENASAARVLEQAYALSKRVADPSARARAACALAWTASRAGEHQRADALVAEGLAQLPADPQFAIDRVYCLLRGSEVDQTGGAAEAAIAQALTAERLLQLSPIPSASLKLTVLQDLAGAYSMAGREREAIAAFEHASATATELGYDDTKTAASLLGDWGIALDLAGRNAEAEKILRHAIDISRAQQGDEVGPELLKAYAGVLHALGRLPEALATMQEAYDKARKTGDRVTMEQAMFGLARLYNDQHDYARSLAMLDQVEPLLRRDLPPGHYAFGKLAAERARAFWGQGDTATALQLSNEAVAIDEAAAHSGQQGAHSLPGAYSIRGVIELAANQPEKAIADLRRAIDLNAAETPAGKTSLFQGRVYMDLARAFQAEGKLADARQAMLAAIKHLDVEGPNLDGTHAAHQLLANLDRQIASKPATSQK